MKYILVLGDGMADEPMEVLEGKTPLEVENDLNAIIPEDDRAEAHHWLILHGRYVCTARKPKCGECGVAQWCPSFKEYNIQ